MSDSIPNIWSMQTEKDTEGLLESLQHADPEVRRRSAVALRIIGDTDAVDPLRILLETEMNPQVRVAVIAALDHLAPRRTETGSLIERGKKPQSRTDRLIEYLTSNRPDAAVQAANALGELGDKVAVPPLIVVFRNQRQLPRVRLAAAEALLKMESAPAEVTLLAALRSEKWHLRRNGAAILGQLRADWATFPLAQALNDEHPHVVRTARAALKRIDTPEAQRWLENPPSRHGDARVIKRETGEHEQPRVDVGIEQTITNRPAGLDEAIAARKSQFVANKGKSALNEAEADSVERPQDATEESVSSESTPPELEKDASDDASQSSEAIESDTSEATGPAPDVEVKQESVVPQVTEATTASPTPPETSDEAETVPPPSEEPSNQQVPALPPPTRPEAEPEPSSQDKRGSMWEFLDSMSRSGKDRSDWTGELDLPRQRRKSRRRKSATRRLQDPGKRSSGSDKTPDTPDSPS